MQIGSIVAVFFVVWWLSFVAVLPIGNRSQSEAGEVVAGTDPGAPVAPRLGKKILLATAVAAVATALLLWGLSNETLHHYWNR
jgi:predicted secreted protein